MLFDKNDDVRNERILYQTKPNMLFGCKKAVYGIVLLAVVLMVAPTAIKFIGDMQVYLVSRISLALTRYAAVAFFIVILIIIIFIIWQLMGWYSKEYILTESRVIIKSGILSTKKNYMPYATIQDINTSQSIIGKVFNVGSIYLFSAYDNNQMELSSIGNPSEIEDIIFTNMVNSRGLNQNRSFPQNSAPHYERGFQQDNVPYERGFPQNDAHYERGFQQDNAPYERGFPQDNDYYERGFQQDNAPYERSFLKNDDYYERNERYDEFEPITPIGREKDNYPKREYEYYPDDLSYEENTRNRYEYEPYNGEYYGGESRLYNDASPNYSEPSNQYSQRSSYNELRDDYSYNNDDYYSDNDSETYYNGNDEEVTQDKQMDVDESSEKVIRRHFDKFKR